MTYHFHCPADGLKCLLTQDDPDSEETFNAECPNGHGWVVTFQEVADSDDGTAVFGFQCGMTHVSAMYGE